MNFFRLLLITLVIISFSCSGPGKKYELKKGESIEISKSGDSVLVKMNNKGNLIYRKLIKNGKLNGRATTYYPGGEIKFEEYYSNDKKNGISKWFYESGILYKETPYVNDNIEGWERVYYPSGEIMAEIPYQNGEPVTGTREYDNEGNLITDYPYLQAYLDDSRVANGGDYMLKIYFSERKLQGFYYYYNKKQNGDSTKIGIPVRSNKIAYIIYKAQEGDKLPERLMLYGEFVSKLGNPVVTKALYVAQ